MSYALNLLLIEHDPLARQAILLLIKERCPAYQISSVASLSDAQHLLATRQFDIVLTDSALPDGSVLDLADRYPDMPMIVIANPEDDAIMASASLADIHDYVLKDPDHRYIKMLPHRILKVFNIRLAAHQLKESEERWKFALEGSGDGAWDWDAQTNKVFFSSRWKHMLGYADHEIGETLDEWDSRVHPDDKARVYEEIDKHFRGKTPCYISEHRVRCKNGTYKWILDRGKVLSWTPDGKPLRVVGTHTDITEQKETEAHRKSVQQRFESLFEHAPLGIAILSTSDGRFLHVNQRYTDILGRTKAELQATTFMAVTHPDDLQNDLDQMTQLRANAIPFFTIPKRYVRKDGSIAWGQLTVAPLWSPNETPAYHMAIVEDITERKLQDQAWVLVARAMSTGTGETFFRSLVSALATALDADYAFLSEFSHDAPSHCSTRAFWQCGALADNIDYALPNTPCDRVRIDGWAAYPCEVQRQFPHATMLTEWGAHAYIGVRLSDSKGRALGLLSALYRRPLHSTALGESILKIFAARVSAELERSRMQETLQHSEALSRSVIESAMDAIITCDDTQRIIVFNAAAEAMFRCPAAAAIGGPLDRFIPERDRARHRMALQEFSRAPQRARSMGQGRLIHALRQDGKEFPAEASISTSNGIMGTLYTVVMRDVSQREDMSRQLRVTQEQLASAQKMEAIGRLAGKVAHDFNNLLSVVLGYSQRLLKALPPTHQYYAPIMEIKKAGDRGAVLTTEILTFSKPQSAAPSLLNLSTVVADMRGMLLPLLGDTIHLTLDLADGLPAVLGTIGEIEGIVSNLTVNARDAMPNGGTLRISTAVATRDQRPFVQLVLQDSGTGMSDAVKAHIFEPFYTTKPAGKGTGLGLAIVYNLVKHRHGLIEIDSQVGHGTTFSIYFPAAHEQLKAARGPLQTEGARTLRAILVVDDDGAFRGMLARLFEDLGWQVLEAPTGYAALDMIAQRRVDLVMTDVNMPEMSGLELRDIIASRWPDLKVLFMSGETPKDALASKLVRGHTGFVPKPIHEDTLTQVLATLFEPSPDRSADGVMATPTSPRHILLVEDDPELRTFLAHVLEEARYRVTLAANGQDAIKLIRLRPVDLLLTDLIMPDMDGIELIRQLRAISSRTAIVAMSGGGEVSADLYLDLASQLGAMEVIKKPFSTDDLLSTLRRIFEAV